MAGSGVSFLCLTVQIAGMWVTGILSERYARNVKKGFSVDCQRYVMDQNKDKQKLNDELLDKVSGGEKICEKKCPDCGLILAENPEFVGPIFCSECKKYVTLW